MERFTRLFCELDQTTRTNDKVAALERYFREVAPADAAWALQFLSGRIPKRVVPTRNLWDWAAEESQLPRWLMDECYESVGDSAETIALLLPDAGKGTGLSLNQLVNERLLQLRDLSEVSRRELLVRTWRELTASQRLVWNKLITGEFRVGVARTLVIRALANVAGVEQAVMSHRVMGDWQPSEEAFLRILSAESDSDTTARAYPFFLASPLEGKWDSPAAFQEALGGFDEWQCEWKWDGIRAQLIHRNGETCIWSRGDEMVTDSFPELQRIGMLLPEGTVLDGEIVAWRGGAPLPFGQLQRRLGRKRVSERIQGEFPVVFVAYDLLEADAIDIRELALSERRARLEQLVTDVQQRFPQVFRPEPAQRTFDWFCDEESREPEMPLRLSALLPVTSWEALGQIQMESRARGVEGVMLKRRSSPYRAGRVRGDWWKWKVNPFLVDAVLIYAQRGHGRRASLYTDYTFGLWNDGELVPVAKAYSGLTDEEIRKVDAFVRNHSLGKRGPVRIVKPELVFELAFEGIQQSTRHKAGIALRFPRMHRWRHDKKPGEADSIATLKSLL